MACVCVISAFKVVIQLALQYNLMPNCVFCFLNEEYSKRSPIQMITKNMK